MRPAAAFTLIELICVMTLLVVTLALVAPSLGGFFRGRTVDSEIRRFLSLTVYGQSRAVSEGVPMLLWVDPDERAYGLQAEGSYQSEDGRRVAYALDRDVEVQVELARSVPGRTGPTPAGGLGTSRGGAAGGLALGRNAAVIRFQPDGFVGETSPLGVGFREAVREGGRQDRERPWVYVARSLNGLTYEVQTNLSVAVRR